MMTSRTESDKEVYVVYVHLVAMESHKLYKGKEN